MGKDDSSELYGRGKEQFETEVFKKEREYLRSRWETVYSPTRKEKLTEKLFLVGKQLRLMENVFVALDLDRPRNQAHAGNQGWMTLFRLWAGAWHGDPSFLEAYQSRALLHSWRFREFCTGVLDLPESSDAEGDSK